MSMYDLWKLGNGRAAQGFVGKNRSFPSPCLAWRSALPQNKDRDKGLKSQAAQAKLFGALRAHPHGFYILHLFLSKVREWHL